MSIAAHPIDSRRRYYIAMVAFMSLLVLVGFWPTYFGQILKGIPERPIVVHLHGLIFVGWMVLLAVQVFLAASGRVRLHRSLGSLGIAYGFLVLAMGIIISVAAPVLHVKAGEQQLDEAAGFMIIPLGDMVLFAAFFIPAVIYRNRPEIHKRFIVLATTALLFAAVGRMNFLPIPVRLLIWFSPVFAGLAYDRWTRGKVHPVYFIGMPLMAIVFTRIFFTQSGAWLQIGRAIVRAFV